VKGYERRSNYLFIHPLRVSAATQEKLQHKA
jgi:hypothetical protein